uniref:Uncharacterized protein n=1 Tax=Arundo donax TaxID=35708 RepID=A0A0A8YNW2_ARUDO
MNMIIFYLHEFDEILTVVYPNFGRPFSQYNTKPSNCHITLKDPLEIGIFSIKLLY